MESLDRRLATAQLLSELLKQERLIRFHGKADEAGDAIRKEVEVFVKSHLQNLLLKVMGEVSDAAFTEEETAILKAMAHKIRGATK